MQSAHSQSSTAGESRTPSDRQIVVERLIRAPRRLVWKAWTEPGHIEQWWGPDGFSTTTHERDFRPGGRWRFTMHSPDGQDYLNRIEYVDIAEPERISYRHAGEGEHEAIRFVSDVTFKETAEGTLVRLSLTFPTAEERDIVIRERGAVEGGRQTLGRLDAHVRAMAGE